jgi:general secretion pathway protein B
MSYILDALRKSETERRQGKIPDLGQQVQLIHRPRKKRIPLAAWVVAALMVNAAVLAVVLWPSSPVNQPVIKTVLVEPPLSVPEPAPNVISEEKPAGVQKPAPTGKDTASDVPADVPSQAVSDEPVWERPTIIVPSPPDARDYQPLPDTQPAGRVPHLVELPLSFQKSIPDLTFNSHIYASEPSARRVMINNNYLRRGDVFSGLKVENITEDGVVLSKHGQRFRVGIVRDWVSPR